MTKPFVHLHVHSHYSLLDGAAKIPDLVQTALEYKMPALAITDHGNLFGALEFYNCARKAGIKPIIGYEAYISPHDRTLKEKQYAKYHHITLLAKNYTGYRNLLVLASQAYLTGFYYKPRIDKELLAQHCQGLIVLSGCLASETCQHIIAGDMEKARQTVAFYRDIFGEDFYIEIQKNKISEQDKANQGLVALAGEFNLPMVFTNDIHYLRQEDAKPHEILLCIQTGTTLDDERRFKFASEEFYMKTSEQMYQEAEEFSDAAKNTMEIAEKVDLQIPMGENHLPPFTPPQGKSNEDYLHELCQQGLQQRYSEITPEITERFEHEFTIICRMGFASYFLIVWDFINYARSQGIPVGPGRGSAAGSLVAYSLRITNLDPLKYQLIFERFLNEGRQEMPDIDIDFETERRGEVIDYVTKKYGEKQVCQIITFGTMAARGVVRDVGRVLGVPLAEVDKIAKKIPTGPKMTLQKGLEADPDFKKLYDSDQQARELIDIGKRLEGLVRQPGTHAAGVIIADRDLSEYCPLYRNVDKTVSTQYSMEHIDSLGLLKMDFLGLSTLTLIQKSLEIIEAARDLKLNSDEFPLDDKLTYQMLSRGETKGVFQLESDGMRELVKKLQPDRFEDIIALVALYRPGPLGSGMVETYCRCKHGQQQPVYQHPVLKNILEETYGIILYQEQAMQIAKDLAGFSLSEADRLRKAMGKKKKELMDAYRQKFIDGARQHHDIAAKLAEEVFDLIDYFSGYGFNKSHSAAYAMVAYQTAYLKARYPQEFMAALMTIESQNTDKIVRYIHECETMGIKVLPPDINESQRAFSVSPAGIRFGFAAIKGVGGKAVEPILTARRQVKKFQSLFHLCEQVDTRLVNKQVLEALIKSGSMDSFGQTRSQISAAVPTALQVGHNTQKQRQNNQMTLFDDLFNAEEETTACDHLYPDVAPWPEKEKLKYEKETMGFYFSGHPLKRWAHYIEMLSSHRIAQLQATMRADLLIGAMIDGFREIPLKSGRNQGKKMAQLQLDDLSGICSAICFPDVYQANQSLIRPDQILFFRGRMNQKKEEPELIIDEVVTVEKGLEILPKTIIIRLLQPNEDQVYELRSLCGGHRGECRTMLRIENNGYEAVIEVAEKFYLQPCLQFFQEIEKLLGKDTVLLSR